MFIKVLWRSRKIAPSEMWCRHARATKLIQSVLEYLCITARQLSLSLPAPQFPLSPQGDGVTEHWKCATLLRSIVLRVVCTVGIYRPNQNASNAEPPIAPATRTHAQTRHPAHSMFHTNEIVRLCSLLVAHDLAQYLALDHRIPRSLVHLARPSR